MVTVEMEVVKRLCDFCKQEALFNCQICGKDVCNDCHGIVRFERMSFRDGIITDNDFFILCSEHYAEMTDYLQKKLLVARIPKCLKK